MNPKDIAEQTMRRNIGFIVTIERDYFEAKLITLIEQLKPPVLREESYNRLKSSADRLLKMVENLSTDFEYLKTENPDRFTDYMDQIQETIKTFFRSYLIQENLSH